MSDPSPRVLAYLEGHPDWHLVDGHLSRLFKFPTYLEGIDFVVRVGDIAESLDHHPDMHVGYCQVRLSTISHDVGELTDRDLNLVDQVDAMMGQ
jgi:4a-hydroxytetrahydrobiopterin dehydratase